MQQLTQEGQRAVADIANRYGLSTGAVEHMLVAVNNGSGSMAQFNVPELGGSGQWMRGGMTMVGDMFNNGLKATVDNLCNELSQLLANTQVFPPAPANSSGSRNWWPDGLGVPSSSGSQNNTRYAVFPQRLAVEVGGNVTVYDTLDHSIGGVSQQQGGSDSLSFSSQYGTVSVSSLPIVSGGNNAPQPNSNFASPNQNSGQSSSNWDSNSSSSSSQQSSSNDNSQANSGNSSGNAANAPAMDQAPAQSGNQEPVGDMLALIEKLGQLHSAGVLSDEEFNAKKSELLSRI